MILVGCTPAPAPTAVPTQPPTPTTAPKAPEPTKAPVPTVAPTAAPPQPLLFLATQNTPVEEQEKMRNVILKDFTAAKVDFISDAEGVVVDRIIAEQKSGKITVGR